jgi:hypothetical protein
MPVHIEQIDTEIEIRSGTAGSQPMPVPAGPTAAATTTSLPLRQAVLSVLETELDEYLRSRG